MMGRSSSMDGRIAEVGIGLSVSRFRLMGMFFFPINYCVFFIPLYIAAMSGTQFQRRISLRRYAVLGQIFTWDLCLLIIIHA